MASTPPYPPPPYSENLNSGYPTLQYAQGGVVGHTQQGAAPSAPPYQPQAEATQRASTRAFNALTALFTGLGTLFVAYALNIPSPHALVISLIVGTIFGFAGSAETRERVWTHLPSFPRFSFPRFNFILLPLSTPSFWSPRRVFYAGWGGPSVRGASFGFHGPTGPSLFRPQARRGDGCVIL